MAGASSERRSALELLSAAVQADIHFLAAHPEELFACLWARAWWFDTAESERHLATTAEAVDGEGRAEGRSRADGPLSLLLEQARAARSRRAPARPWLRSLRPPGSSLRSAQRVVLRGHHHAVRGVHLSPDGRRIVTHAGDLRLWDAGTGAPLRTIGSFVAGFAASIDGRRLATADGDGEIRVWAADTGEPIAVLSASTRGVGRLTFSPDGCWLASCGSCGWNEWGRPVDVDPAVSLQGADGAAPPRMLLGHTGLVTALGFAPDGSRLFSAAGDSLRLWDVPSGAEVWSVPLSRNVDDGASAVWSRSGSKIAVVGPFSEVVAILESASGRALAQCAHRGSAGLVGFTADDGRLVTSSSGGALHVWDAASGREIRSFEGGEPGFAFAAALSPDGERIAHGAADRTAFRLSSLRSESWSRRFVGHEAGVTALAFSTDGRAIVSGSEDRTARIWSVSAAAATRPLVDHDEAITGLAFSPDGSALASAGRDGTIRLWDAATGREERRWATRGLPSQIAFFPDGRRLAVLLGRTTLSLLDEDGRDSPFFQRDAEAGDVLSLAVAADGSQLACGCEHAIRIFDAGAVGAAPRATIPLHGLAPGTAMAFSTDRRRLAVFHAARGGAWTPEGIVAEPLIENRVRIWDLTTLAVVAGREPAREEVTAVAFSPDDRQLVTVSGSTRTWEVDSGRLLAERAGAADAAAVAAGARRFPWLAFARTHAIEVERADSGPAVARLPGRYSRLAAHPGGRLWAAAQASHLCLLRLEE